MLVLHRAERTDTLADELAEVLSVPLRDPMRQEIVSVPARGVERWLQQHLAGRLGATSPGAGSSDRVHTDGIAANLRFDTPSTLADRITDAVRRGGSISDVRAGRESSRWRADDLVWPVLRVLDTRIGDPRLRVIARHLGIGDGDTPGNPARAGRRYATARFIADLFERYGAARPAMIAAWARGETVTDAAGNVGDTDGAGGIVRGDMAWQPDFWRRVRAEVGTAHPAEELDAICERLRTDPGAGDLPERLCVFGPTRVTETFRRVITAVSVHHDVHVFLPHPSPVLWSAGIGDHGDGPDGPLPRARFTRAVPAHPLLSSLSRDVAELQQRLGSAADDDRHHPPSPASSTPAETTLGALQAGLRDNELRLDSVPYDSSVEVHACHGAERQVEVMRDRLLHLFDADPTLESRDVLVMCPDVETFTPLIRGAFGQSGLNHPAYELRVRLADRGLRQANPVLDVIATVVELAAGRLKAGEVTDLLSREPVRRRFAMDDDDLEMVREWMARSNIRWGLGDAERARFDLGQFRQGTFESGLDRIALGAVSDERSGEWLGTALALDAVESTAIDLYGRFDEFVRRLGDLVERMVSPRPVTEWIEILGDTVDALTAAPLGEEWMTTAAHRAIDRLFGGVGSADESVGDRGSMLLHLADIRDVMSGLAVGRPTRSNFRTGELTVCTMVPMRSVPHRVIVLLGIDADAFPRVQRIDGDDILGCTPLVGERHPRDEDRQTFLDAICAARDSLHIFYSGADPVSGRHIPPAVVVSELVDTVSAMTGVDAGTIVTRHTLHAFDTRNFVAGAFAGFDGALSHDTEMLAGARALQDPVAQPARPPSTVRLETPALTGDAESDVDLVDLVRFHIAPVESFYRQRLGAWIPADSRAHADELDIELGHLERWGVGDRFLTRMLGGASLAECQAAELRRGTLPPFVFGTGELKAVSHTVSQVHAATVPLLRVDGREVERETLDVVVTLPDGRRVHGTVGDAYAGRIVTATYSKIKAKQRLTAWIRLLGVGATLDPDRRADISAVVVGRAPYGGGVLTCRLRMPDDPAAILEQLVRLRDRGLTRVLPVGVEAADALAQATRNPSRPAAGMHRARGAFDSMFGEHTDRYVRMAFGGDVDAEVAFDDLAAERIGDDPAGWPSIPGAADDALFAGLARAVWQPLLDHEERT